VGTGPWDLTRAGTPGRNRFLASDADRERAIDLLKTAFVQGVLTRDELAVRTGQALASRTYGQLATVTAGLAPAARKPEARKPEARKPEARKPEARKPEATRPEARTIPAPARRRVSRKVVAWSACAIILPPALAATFLSYYGGFLVMMLFTFVGVVVSSKPPAPRRGGPAPPHTPLFQPLASSMGWQASTSKSWPEPPTTPTARPRRGPCRSGTSSPRPSSKAGEPSCPP
jgi:hypothetical protein